MLNGAFAALLIVSGGCASPMLGLAHPERDPANPQAPESRQVPAAPFLMATAGSDLLQASSTNSSSKGMEHGQRMDAPNQSGQSHEEMHRDNHSTKQEAK